MTEEEAKESLSELKESAELMIDLAYSSLIYDNIDLANEVYQLEDESDERYDRFQRIIVEDSKKGGLTTDEALALIRLGAVMESICDAAREIADVELRDIELHPVIKMSIEESDETFVREVVDGKSVLCDKSLGETRVASELGAWVIAIKRGNRWHYNPGKFTHIKEGDVLFARTTREAERHFRDVIRGKTREV